MNDSALLSLLSVLNERSPLFCSARPAGKECISLIFEAPERMTEQGIPYSEMIIDNSLLEEDPSVIAGPILEDAELAIREMLN